MHPDDTFRKACVADEAARAIVSAYNEAVDVANAAIAVKKQETEAADARAVETALAGLRAQKARHIEAVHQACVGYQGRLIEKAYLETQKTETREQLDQHTGQVIAKYGQSINRYLDRVNAGFRITTPTHTYRGARRARATALSSMRRRSI